MSNDVIETTGEEISSESTAVTELSATEYFEDLKSKAKTIEDSELIDFYNNCLELEAKYRITGQSKAERKLRFFIDSIEKEREIIKMGINKYVYRDDIKFYIKSVTNNVVKIINIEAYEREIPDDIVAIIDKVRGKFDTLYVLFYRLYRKRRKEDSCREERKRSNSFRML